MNKGRKISGGLYHKNRKTRSHERPGQLRKVILGETKKKQVRARSGKRNTILLRANTVNIMVDGKVKKAEIKNVIETPQNKFFSRENRLMKSAVIETSIGKARITNRPSQEGCVNAILIK